MIWYQIDEHKYILCCSCRIQSAIFYVSLFKTLVNRCVAAIDLDRIHLFVYSSQFWSQSLWTDLLIFGAVIECNKIQKSINEISTTSHNSISQSLNLKKRLISWNIVKPITVCTSSCCWPKKIRTKNSYW